MCDIILYALAQVSIRGKLGGVEKIKVYVGII